MKQPIQRTPEQIAKLATLAGAIELPTVQALKELDPMQHDVFDEGVRKKKDVKKPNGIIDPKTGKEGMTTSKEEVNRIAVPFQELIVKRRVAFMNVGALELHSKPVSLGEGSKGWSDEEKLFEIVKKIREDNKMQYRETEVAKRMLTELQCAKLWYTDDVEAGYWGELAPTSKKSVRCKILSPALGDKLYPVFDSYGKMVYFARSFKSKPNLLEAEDVDAEAKEKDILEVYSSDRIWTFEQEDGVWIPKNEESHTFGKIPVIYYQKDNTPWANVQPIINRIEEVLSNFADTTDYNGAPILVGIGKIKGMSERGERGKTFEIDNGGDLKYVTWDQAPEAIKLELETLVNLVYTCTQTPDISTKGMAELAIESGVAFDRVFIDAHLAAKDEIAGGYGESTQREINLLKAIAVNVINTGLKKVEGLEIGFNIPLFRINDKRETVDTVSTAYMGGLISQETAVSLSGLTDDAAEEFERIKKEDDTLGKEVEEFE